MLLRVRQYFAKEKDNKGPLFPVNQVIRRTMEATGVSGGTYKRVINKQVRKKYYQV